MNPDHLEPVTHRENILRGEGIRTTERLRALRPLREDGMAMNESHQPSKEQA